MSDAIESTQKSAAISANTIRPEEAAHFGRLASEWWDPNGSSAMLHKLNPVRLAFVRGAIDAHWPEHAAKIRPLMDLRALDVGCGAGLLAEPLARLGADVTGVDAAAENIAAAKAHAAGAGLSISYQAGEIGALDIGQFDLICAMEVIEHVADKRAFIAALEAKLAPGGLLILSTPNRTAKAKLLLVDGAEMAGLIPRGTHHHEDFITPEELEELAGEFSLAIMDRSGISFSLSKGLHLSTDESLNYIVSFQRVSV